MKKIKTITLLLLTSVGIFISSCSKKQLDEINQNPNNPSDVSAKFILTDMMTSTAFSVAGGDISLYSSIYMEHETGVYGQTYNAETRTGEPTLATTYNNVWGSIYNNIKALKIAIAKTSAGGPEEGNDVTGGIAKVLLAYNLGVLTDFFGDVPFAQTGILNPDGSLVSHYEFENAFANHLGGSTFMNGVLSRSKRVGNWQISLAGSPACYPNGAPCWIVEPGTPIEGGVLSVATPTTGPNAGKFVLSGSTTAPRAAQISVVQTGTDDCPAVGTCTVSSFGFTQKVLTAPIDLAEGQIIQVTVVISFS